MKKMLMTVCLILVLLGSIPAVNGDPAPDKAAKYAQEREYLKSILYTRPEVEKWLAGKQALGEQYDSLTGWVYKDGWYDKGDGTRYAYHYDRHGARIMLNHADQPCRINTYGDSMTQCAEFNDGESWQEFLAARLGEPVRNYGVGGYSVYQAYLRMRREEQKTPAKYIILNIFSDDNYRNLHGWRNILSGYTFEKRLTHPVVPGGISSPPGPWVEANPAKGVFIEHANPCPTAQDIYHLCDLDWVMKHFQDDFVLKIALARRNAAQGTPEKSYAAIGALAKDYGIDARLDGAESLLKIANAIFTEAGLYATIRIIGLAEDFAAKNGKKILYVLSYAPDTMVPRFQTGERFDQELIDFLRRKRLFYVDTMEAHVADYARFKISPDEYFQTFFSGHYTPMGNLFQANAILPQLLEMLYPKPRTYLPTR